MNRRFFLSLPFAAVLRARVMKATTTNPPTLEELIALAPKCAFITDPSMIDERAWIKASNRDMPIIRYRPPCGSWTGGLTIHGGYIAPDNTIRFYQ